MNFSILKVIRPIKESDLVYLNEWKNDYDTFKYLGNGYHPISIDEQKLWMSEFVSLTGKNRRFMIQPKQSTRPIGMIGLYDINFINRTAELGIYIGEKEWRGKGIAQKAYFELENFAVGILNLRKIKLFVVADNAKGISFFNKNNFIKVGKLNKERYIEGVYCDVLIFEKIVTLEKKQ